MSTHRALDVDNSIGKIGPRLDNSLFGKMGLVCRFPPTYTGAKQFLLGRAETGLAEVTDRHTIGSHCFPNYTLINSCSLKNP